LTNKRPLRVAATLRGYLAYIIPEVMQWNKKFTPSDFHLVDVRMTPDLRLATLVIFDNNKESVTLLKYLNELAPNIQYKLAPHITGKYVPKVRFVFDRQIKREQEMLDLMESIRKDLETEEKDLV
jgi:ribosome-binding factor A